MKYYLRYWFPVFLYCLIIFLQSSRPAPSHLPLFPYSDKGLHIIAYALLGILFLRAFATLPLINRPFLLLSFSILAAGLYGISDEIHQHFVPLRHVDGGDAIADFIGAIVGVCGYYFLSLKANPNRFSD